MIDELCSRIWYRNEFQDEKNQLVLEGLKYSLRNGLSQHHTDTLPRLLQCATHFSLSNNHEHRKAAYEIAVNAWKICNTSDTNGDISTQQLANVISFIFTRLGNFPAEQFLKQQISAGFFENFPQTLWMEQEFHREENTVRIAEKKSLILTDFQHHLWLALEKFQVVAVNAPTSAGKSFALQNFLAALFAQGRLKRAVYLVPTRALISQVQNDLSRLIRHDLELNIQITEVPQDSNPEETIIFVLTQERLQILLDQSDQMIDFLIVDEAQGISESSRGIILQSVIERVKEGNSDANILFGSPFTKNPEIFANTFGIDQSDFKVIATDESPVAQNIVHIATNKYRTKKIKVSRIGDNEKHYDLLEIDVGTELVKDEQTLAQLSCILGKESLNIVYGSEPVKCEKIAGIISEIVSLEINGTQINPELKEFSDFIKVHIHKQFSLSEYVKNGVAYHYGNLPPFLRKGLEYLFSEGKIAFIVCTSTLLQGVNLPAQNMFMMKPSKGIDRDRQPIPLTPTEFWNLAGRAGRLTKDFEGNVYLINLNDWSENPLGKKKTQRITPSFSVYICKKSEELFEFIRDENHASSANEGLENTFMKLYNDFKNGRIEEVLSHYKESLSPETINKIISEISLVSEKISVPLEVTEKNPNISVYRQQDMLNYLLSRIEKKGPEYVIPPHPLIKYASIKNDYLRLFKRLHTYFEKMPGRNRSHVYYSNLALLWMRGRSYAELLKDRIAHQKNTRVRGEPNANTEARILFREIENNLRFRYVKYTRCYSDILFHALELTDNQSYIGSIPPIYLFLELGACSKTMISLIGIGITRTGASILAEFAPRTDMERDDTTKWLRATNLTTKGLPITIIKEIEDVL